MIFRRRRSHGTSPTGYYRFENAKTRAAMVGHGSGEFVRLRDDYGNVWNGIADPQGDNIVRYLLRNDRGQSLTGISDSSGVILRDEKGNTWRGVVE